MNRFLIALLLVLPAVAAKKEHDWKMAKVLDAGMAKTYVTSGASTSTTTDASGNSHSQTDVQTLAIRDNQLLLLSDEFAYVVADTRLSGGGGGLIGLGARAVSNRHHGCRFIVSDSVKFYQDKAMLHVIDTDGKECKAEVLRQERLTKP